jgi:hypothetical protein
LSPAEADVATGAMAEGGSVEPAGGGGGGSAIPDTPATEIPNVATLAPEAALTAAGAAPPAQLAAALGGVKAAVGTTVGGERAELAAHPPTVARPAGKGSAGTETTPPSREGRDKVEKASEGPEMPTPPPRPVPEPPAPAVDAVREPLVESTPEGELTQEDARRIQGSVGSLPDTDPGLHVTAGPAPQVQLDGNADPARVDEQRINLTASVDATAAEGRTDAAAYLGENDIHDDQPAQSLTASSGGAASGAGQNAMKAGPGVEGPDADAASIIAGQEKGSEIAAAVAAAKAEMATKKQEHVAKVAQEKAKSGDEIAGLKEADAQEQDAVRKGAKEDVRKRRGEWTSEQESTLTAAGKEADAEVKSGYTKVDAEKQGADDKAREEIGKGDAEATQERIKAEQEAARKKKEAEDESSGVLGWLASKAKAFFNKIKSAIKKAFELARRAVKAIIKKAKELAAKAIEAARRAIVSAIKAVGAALIAIGDRVLKHFPTLRAKFRKAITSVVDKAVRTVNKLAAKLNAAIQKVLDVLGNALDAALGLLEKGLLAAVDVVGSVVEGALKFANSVVQALAAFAVLVKDVASGPMQWLKNLAAGIFDGIRNHLWTAFKSAVNEWFNAKVEQVLGLGSAIWKVLTEGGLSVAQIGRMAWEGIKSIIPMAVVRILIEKLASMIIPAAGAVMIIVEGLQAAWATVGRILAAFSKFFAFLKAVKSGNAGPPFAAALAAAAIAVIDFIANWLLQKLAKGAIKVAGKLKGIAKRLAAKKRAKAAGKKAKAAGKSRRIKQAAGQPHDKQSAKRGKAQQERERRLRKRLERAVATIKPQAARMLAKGTTPLLFQLRLAWWKMRYRLSGLTMDGGGRITARLNPTIVLDDPQGRKVTEAELGRLLMPVFRKAELEYHQSDAVRTPERAAAARAWRKGEAGALGGPALSRAEQQSILRLNRPGAPSVRAEEAVSVGMTRKALESWQVGRVGKVPGPGDYPGMVARLLTWGREVGLKKSDIVNALSAGRFDEAALPKTGVAPGKRQKFVERMRRVSFLVHVVEPARRRGHSVVSATAFSMLGAGQTQLRNVIQGSMAPMAPVGAASQQESARARAAAALGQRRVGTIFSTLLEVTKNRPPLVSRSNPDLNSLAEAVRGWLSQRLAEKRDPAALAAAQAKLVAGIIRLLTNYYGRST